MICGSYKRFFSTLSNPTKLEIINLLSKGPMNVSDLCKKLSMEQSRVSHSLRILSERGFVHVRNQGRQRIYSLDDAIIQPILKLIDKHVNKYEIHYCKCKGTKWRERR